MKFIQMISINEDESKQSTIAVFVWEDEENNRFLYKESGQYNGNNRT